MALTFTEHEDVVFKRAPLVTVLCQIQFEPVLSLLGDVGVAGFQEGLRHLYPHFRAEQSAEIEVADQSVGFKQTAPVWRLLDDDERWRVSLAVNFVALETPRYRDFTEFLDRLFLVLDVLERTVHPGDATRIGLRKVNHLTHPDVKTPADWQSLLRPELLGLVGVELPADLAVSLSDVRLRDGVNEFVVRHGVISDEPAKYLLDVDHSSPVPYEIGANDALREVLSEFSGGITSFFIGYCGLRCLSGCSLCRERR